MQNPTFSRRAFMGTTAIGCATLSTMPAHAGIDERNAVYDFEVQRTEGEWREMLTDEEFRILREGGTEPARSHPFWEASDEGTYHCKGCDLPLYESDWKVILPMGWVFFYHSLPTTVVTDIDASGPMPGGTGPAISVACRRCGSHQGHIVAINREVIHCINGTSLTFRPSTA